MKAFGNHFRVEYLASARMQTYDCGIASIFEVSTIHAIDVFINYVGVVKDILKLDYGLLSRPIVLQSDNWGNPTYTHDNTGFLVVNVQHSLPMIPSFLLPKNPKSSIQTSPINPDRRLFYVKKHAQKERLLKTQILSSQRQLRLLVLLLQHKSYFHQTRLY